MTNLNPGPDNYDFTGIATQYGVECNDGRTILHGAFSGQDGDIVPIIYRHQHDKIGQVLGHGLLKATDEGMRLYGLFAATEEGKKAKILVHGGTLRFLSIYANKLLEKAKQVRHGIIREVSLVLAGSNPGASIDNVVLHSSIDDDGYQIQEIDPQSAFIHSGIAIEIPQEEEDDLNHADEDESLTVGDVLATLNEEQQAVVSYMVAKSIRHEDPADGDSGDIDVQAVYDTLNEKQLDAVFAILGEAVNNKEISHSDLFGDDLAEEDEGEESMTHNIWENDEQEPSGGTLSHSALNEIVANSINDADSGKTGSVKEAFIQHAKTYGISNPELLFPEAKEVYGNGTPHIHDEDKSWVARVISGAHKSPFGKIRTTHNDMTESTARARGHIATNQKWDEVFTVLRRETTEKMVYIRTKFDREDLIQITDFDALMYVKSLLRYKWDEEVAQAILIGDGRAVDHDDKIDETKIRPIWTDDSLYTTRKDVANGMSYSDFVDFVTEAQEDFYGSGTPTLFVTRTLLTKMLLIKDMNGRRIYLNKSELASAMDVKDIVAVTNFTGKTRDDGGTVKTLMGMMFNPTDYTIGANKGGKLAVFDQFDIDVNQQKYLMEAFISGALTKIKCAVVFEELPAA